MSFSSFRTGAPTLAWRSEGLLRKKLAIVHGSKTELEKLEGHLRAALREYNRALKQQRHDILNPARMSARWLIPARTGISGDPMPEQSCQSRDLACGGSALLLWGLPVAALIVGANWRHGLLLWIPAFLVMGAACLANAAQCGRLHCYITGPLFLVAAVYAALS